MKKFKIGEKVWVIEKDDYGIPFLDHGTVDRFYYDSYYKKTAYSVYVNRTRTYKHHCFGIFQYACQARKQLKSILTRKINELKKTIQKLEVQKLVIENENNSYN